MAGNYMGAALDLGLTGVAPILPLGTEKGGMNDMSRKKKKVPGLTDPMNEMGAAADLTAGGGLFGRTV